MRSALAPHEFGAGAPRASSAKAVRWSGGVGGRLGTSEAGGQPCRSVKPLGYTTGVGVAVVGRLGARSAVPERQNLWVAQLARVARWSQRDGGGVSQAEVEKRSEAGEG